jgi:hypothetical protein
MFVVVFLAAFLISYTRNPDLRGSKAMKEYRKRAAHVDERLLAVSDPWGHALSPPRLARPLGGIDGSGDSFVTIIQDFGVNGIRCLRAFTSGADSAMLGTVDQGGR